MNWLIVYRLHLPEWHISLARAPWCQIYRNGNLDDVIRWFFEDFGMSPACRDLHLIELDFGHYPKPFRGCHSI